MNTGIFFFFPSATLPVSKCIMRFSPETFFSSDLCGFVFQDVVGLSLSRCF